MKWNKQNLSKLASQFKNRKNSLKNLLDDILLLKNIENKYTNKDLKDIIQNFEHKRKLKKSLKNNFQYNKNYTCKFYLDKILQYRKDIKKIHDILNNINNTDIHAWYLKLAHANMLAYNTYYINLKYDDILKSELIKK